MSPRPKKPRNCKCPHHLPGSVIIKPAGIPAGALEKINSQALVIQIDDADGEL